MVAYLIFDSYSGNDDYAAAGLWLPRSGPAEFADGRTLDDVRILRTVAAVATGRGKRLFPEPPPVEPG
jgi:hypothetical protein